MFYLRELMQDYKTEVKDILSADRQLAKEIEFDLRKFEEEQEEIKRLQDQQNTVQSLQGTPGSSPRPVVTGPVSKSPQVTPVARPPGAVRSPGRSPAPQNKPSSPTVPVLQLNKSLAGPKDSARDYSLSTVAILNSARKAFLKAKENSPSASGTKTRRKSCLVTENKSAEMENKSAEGNDETAPLTVRFAEDLLSGSSDSVSTPPRATRSTDRAISTPTGALDNITFYIDQNVTLIPPSPIPSSMPIRVYPADVNSAPPTCMKSRRDKPDKDFIYMFSPDKPLPKPRKWNVNSPAPKKNLSLEQDDLSLLSKSDSVTSTDKGNKGKQSHRKSSKENSSTAAVVRRRSARTAKNK